MIFRCDVGGSNAWPWSRRIAFSCICGGALLITLFGDRSESDARKVIIQDNISLTTTKPSKVFLLEDNRALREHYLTASAEDKKIDEDEEFFHRLLEERYGSGPFRPPSSEVKGKGESKSSKSSNSEQKRKTFDEDEEFFHRKAEKGYRSGPSRPSSSKGKQTGKTSEEDEEKKAKNSPKSPESRKLRRLRTTDEVEPLSEENSYDMSKRLTVHKPRPKGKQTGKTFDEDEEKKAKNSPKSPESRKLRRLKTTDEVEPLSEENSYDMSKRLTVHKPRRLRFRDTEKNEQNNIIPNSLPATAHIATEELRSISGRFYQSHASEPLSEENNYDMTKHLTVHKSRLLRFRDTRKNEHNKIIPNSLAATAHIATEELQSISSRFYIYDDPAILQSHIVDKYRRMGKAALGASAELDHVKTDLKGEQLILEVLDHHPLKTSNPEDAEIFIVPTPITELLAYGCQWENCTWYDDAFNALSNHPIFKKTQGHKHVIVALSWPSFNKRYSAFIPALSRNYNRLKNVTVAHNYDPFGCLVLREQSKDTSASDFKKVFQGELPIMNAFSLGLGFDKPFPVHLPMYKKFETSDYFIFYHSRVKSFAYGSTKYRNALLDLKVIEALPPSSIGHDVPYDEWVRGFTSSKFCLVVRGDTPHSHSLLYSVRAGCIPVIVSDDYSFYAPTFKSSVALEDFSIFIEEKKFMDNPVKQLKKLQDLPEDYIRTKLDNLYVAQTMIIPDHPQSLFVPAFMKEAIEAEKNFLPQKPRVQLREDYAVLSGWEYLYHFPSTLPESSDSTDTNDAVVIIGVVSKSHHFNARHAIRGTWAAESANRVFFIVAGPWEDIEEEFLEYGDLLWLDMVEDDSLTTNKVQFFLQAVNAHVDSYDYVMKTNDDSYVWLDDVVRHLGSFNPEYWGTWCKTEYKSDNSDSSMDMSSHSQSSKYAHGMGYVLSREFNECAASYTESIGLRSNEEDVATGLLAELCGVSCREAGWDWRNDPTGNGLEFVAGHMKTMESMLYKHWYVLWKRGGWDP